MPVMVQVSRSIMARFSLPNDDPGFEPNDKTFIARSNSPRPLAGGRAVVAWGKTPVRSRPVMTALVATAADHFVVVELGTAENVSKVASVAGSVAVELLVDREGKCPGPGSETEADCRSQD